MSEKINNLDQSSYAVRVGLKRLLENKSTKKNIIWASDNYKNLGEAYNETSYILADTFNVTRILNARINKNEDIKLERTRKRAEVFTPSWVVNQMINFIDEEWFGYKNVFNIEKDKSWESIENKIKFPKDKTWKDYVDSRKLEITCGEAPYLVSRYDVVSGKLIEDLNQRIGILDRKLRIVNENSRNKAEWKKRATRAIEAIYGYEYQGDNLLIARINILLTYVEYYEKRWNERPSDKEIKKIANIIAWNIWQMNGLKDEEPFSQKLEKESQVSLFEKTDEDKKIKATPCRIYDWRSNKSVLFKEIKEKEMKKFDFVIGNPPYNLEAKGQSTSDSPVYNLFMDESFNIADKVLLITPARFLFNAGKTPKPWNEKMLNDKHFKVLKYKQKSSDVFKGTDIKGGVAITYRDESKDFGPIEAFTSFKELASIRNKVVNNNEFKDIREIIEIQSKFDLDALYEDYPEYKNIIGNKGRDKRLRQIIMERLPEIFTKDKIYDDSYKILGLVNKKRAYRYIKKKYIQNDDVLYKYKVFVPSANGSGAIGEVLSTPLIGNTQTFISFGKFDTLYEAKAMLKYVKTKFCRTLLGILKITQGNNKETWANVPLQDFTENSDIDWSKSIAEIDQQLYKKYALDDEEINFIEDKVQEMK
ncbi:Eco57I restriction-modification methylase domain-containing protein [Anaerococcus porci]|uniref:Eco57I restriction-modification methylase domain-containing protein n=1 Tax=Anaerococcus porci TaxID=2652269 RepID=UPI002A75757C|nr:Eco57I restriction-modification methylase domain-containing protein [Anaerococcus porci]MDY3006486.1 Eco57I restriction-modification methylase domain-containing protein [Anaerococcus porci]